MENHVLRILGFLLFMSGFILLFSVVGAADRCGYSLPDVILHIIGALFITIIGGVLLTIEKGIKA